MCFCLTYKEVMQAKDFEDNLCEKCYLFYSQLATQAGLTIFSVWKTLYQEEGSRFARH